jgi:hypothetical protein
MLSFKEAIDAGDWKFDAPSGLLWKDLGDFQICLEPLLFDEQFYLAVYDKEKNLLFEKIPMKPGKV